jgi:hypothetical protein
MTYATKAQLATFTGVAEGVLPADSERLLKRASELIQDSTASAVYDVDSSGLPTLAAAVTAFSEATCAQVEYWLAGDEEDDVLGPLQGMSVGNQRQQFEGSGAKGGSSRVSPMYLAPRADRILRLAGFMSGSVYSI